jgi:hypothetical protein
MQSNQLGRTTLLPEISCATFLEHVVSLQGLSGTLVFTEQELLNQV